CPPRSSCRSGPSRRPCRPSRSSCRWPARGTRLARCPSSPADRRGRSGPSTGRATRWRDEVPSAWLFSLNEAKGMEANGAQDHIDCLDADEWNDGAAHTVDDEIAAQQFERTLRPILDAAQSERDECDDDERVEDDRGE